MAVTHPVYVHVLMSRSCQHPCNLLTFPPFLAYTCQSPVPKHEILNHIMFCSTDFNNLVKQIEKECPNAIAELLSLSSSSKTTPKGRKRSLQVENNPASATKKQRVTKSPQTHKNGENVMDGKSGGQVASSQEQQSLEEKGAVETTTSAVNTPQKSLRFSTMQYEAEFVRDSPSNAFTKSQPLSVNHTPSGTPTKSILSRTRGANLNAQSADAARPQKGTIQKKKNIPKCTPSGIIANKDFKIRWRSTGMHPMVCIQKKKKKVKS